MSHLDNGPIRRTATLLAIGAVCIAYAALCIWVKGTA
jgi:hypothetical protein